MHIMTDNGWMPLAPQNCQAASNEDGRYSGEIPSPQAEAWLAWIAAEIKELREQRIARRGHANML